MHCNTLSQQVWWLNDRGDCLHPKKQKIKPHKWCVFSQQW